MQNRKYCLISPCRDEAQFLERTLVSVIGQTIRPSLWVIVDDGSTDATPQILAKYAGQHDFIRIIRCDDRGRRSVGPGVVDAFYRGHATIAPDAFAYIGKLDMDLELPPGYFQSLIDRMQADPRLGTCSGKPYFHHPRTGALTSERCGDEMSVGMTKFYRTACFQQIGGLARHVMWDGIDCHQCRMLGWKARSFDERYPDVRIALMPGRSVDRLLNQFDPDAIHIATEGPIGKAARRYCIRRNLPFTTSYHTHFPDYLKRYFGLPTSWTIPYFRKFHAAAQATLVPTPRVKTELDKRGFEHVVTWSRGVDAQLFRPVQERTIDLPRPLFVCSGRVCLEKNLPAFLDLDLPGSKLVIGPGPLLGSLRRRYPTVHFTGYLPADQFAATLACADVFVFPSLTDTFGLVMLEAMACGVPVAAFEVTGPIDVVKQGVTGIMNEDLRVAALAALNLRREDCRAYAVQFTWHDCAQKLLNALVPRAISAAI